MLNIINRRILHSELFKAHLKNKKHKITVLTIKNFKNLVTTHCIYIMKVITVKLNEESWAYIITDTEDNYFIEQKLTEIIDTAKTLYPDCKVSVCGIQQKKTEQIIQKTKERRKDHV